MVHGARVVSDSRSSRRQALGLVGLLITAPQLALAEPHDNLTLDAGLLVASPAVLAGTMSTGIAADITRRCGCHFEYGAQLGWSSASGSSTAWSVTHADLRLRAIGGLRLDAGRGAFSLRAGLGTTVVHETRERNQGERAGLMGDELATSAWRALPAGDLEGVVSLHVSGPWLLAVGGGPSLYVVDGDVRAGWTAQLGVSWQP